MLINNLPPELFNMILSFTDSIGIVIGQFVSQEWYKECNYIRRKLDLPFQVIFVKEVGKNGYLNILKWLPRILIIRTLNFDTLILQVIKYGHINIFKWLWDNFELKTEYHLVCNQAAKYNRVDILNLFENIPSDMIDSIILFRIAVKECSIDVLKWLDDTDNTVRPKNENCNTRNIYHGALKNDRLDVFQWLYNHHFPLYNFMNDAIFQNSINIIKWYYETFLPIWDTTIYNTAVLNDKRDVIKFFIEIGIPLNYDACYYAILNSNLELLEWLVNHNFPFDKSRCMETAINLERARGNKDIIKWLENK